MDVPRMMAALQKVSLYTRALAGVMVLLYVLTFIPGVYRYLAVTPAEVAPPLVHIWVIITGAYIEGSIFGEFIAIVNVATVLATTAAFIFLFAVTGDIGMLFWQFSGFTGCVAGFMVAYKQAYPQHSLVLGPLRLESKDGPLLLILVLTVLRLMHVISMAPVLMAVFGFLAAYIFLRHYQYRDHLRGDPSDAFAFEEFFPTGTHIASLIHIRDALRNRCRSVVRLLCPKNGRAFDLSKTSQLHLNMPDLRNSESNRRQAKALRDLDQRLQSVVVQQAQQKRQAPNNAPDSAASAESSAPPTLSPTPEPATA
ncbi:uncharacterized protein MONBRDRAFT_33994 [Monosiga brevicollis MX1]|uniref:Transmembrane protein 115 n=1 Tax=Monosiga brevicollis TaxID=81824 RepID=A9V903_MONBE|nr:uncharacterized protein MONBRDRAFT_33994 [Monosiga brevicollis MX1]EDQ85968.1 predicted protein [Monosiga brevicollis MX1]|eukprot:XP_001749162.1 hypothetical protein [Monosiga brevicollis MX1]